MSITARHKKPGGFKKLVNSLETTPFDKREKILEIMRKEDPDFTAEVERCVFQFEDFKNTPDMIISELSGGLVGQMKALALALYKCEDQALKDKFLKNMQAKEMLEYREWVEQIKEVKQYEQIGGRFKVIQIARELEAKGKYVLKKYSQHYMD